MTAKRHLILIVDDNEADVFLTRKVLDAAAVQADVQTVSDGQAALEICEKVDGGRLPAPDLILLDLNLPKVTGHEVFNRLRGSHACGDAKIVVVTTSMATADREYFRRSGADDYFIKPSQWDEFLKLGPLVRDLLVGQVSVRPPI